MSDYCIWIINHAKTDVANEYQKVENRSLLKIKFRHEADFIDCLI